MIKELLKLFPQIVGNKVPSEQKGFMGYTAAIIDNHGLKDIMVMDCVLLFSYVLEIRKLENKKFRAFHFYFIVRRAGSFCVF